MKAFSAAAAALAVVLVIAATAGALTPSGSNTNTNGDQTITWSSSFTDDRYVAGRALTVPVTWTTSCGATLGRSVRLRGGGFTPSGVTGTAPQLLSATASSSTFSMRLTSLHQPGRRGVAKGNAQVTVTVAIDQDCDGVTDGTAGLGVNIQVATGDSEPE